MTPRLKQQYHDQVAPKLLEDFSLGNKMAIPKLDKIVLSVGLGKQLEGTKLNPKAREQAIKTLAQVSGQKPVMIKAKRSVANFKLRAGYEVACMVTLRGDRMWEFFDRLVNLALPRIKDFRGLKTTSFDDRGNYTFGVTEQGIFPEVDMANVTFTHGMHITLNFNHSTPEHTRALLEQYGFPFRKPQEPGRQSRAA